MDGDGDLRRAADRNFIGSFAKLAEHTDGGSVRRFGSVVGFITGLPLPIFNGVIVLEPARLQDVDAAADWVRGAGVPHWAWLRESLAVDLAGHLEARGFERRPWLQPVMAIRPPATRPEPSEGVTVHPVEDEAGLEEHIRHMIDSGVPEPMIRRMYVPGFAFDPDVRLFTSCLDGRPMGNSIAIRTGTTSGVYAVGTREEARRRGVGTAATWAAVDAGREWGCSLVVLQSSEMGFGVYEAMGFEVIDRQLILRAAP